MSRFSSPLPAEHTCPSCGTKSICLIENGYCANGCHESPTCDSCHKQQWLERQQRLEAYDPWGAYHEGY